MNKFNAIDDNLLIVKRMCELIKEDYDTANTNINIMFESIKLYYSKINININDIIKHIVIINTKISNRNKAKNSYTDLNMNNTPRKRKQSNRKLKTAKISNVSAKQ